MLRVLSLEGHSFNLLFPPFPHLHFRLRAFAGIHDPLPFRLFLFFVFFVSRLSDPDFSRLRTRVRPSLIARIRNMCRDPNSGSVESQHEVGIAEMAPGGSCRSCSQQNTVARYHVPCLHISAYISI